MNTHAGPSVLVASRNRGERLETFVRAHIERLPAKVRVLYGHGFPTHRDNGRLLLPPGSLPRRMRRFFLRKVFRKSIRDFEEEALVRFLLDNRIAAVLAEYGTTGVHYVRACREARVPLIVHFHGFDAYHRAAIESHRSGYAAMFAEAAAIVAVSRDMERELLRLGAPGEKLHCNPCGVDMTCFAPAAGTRPPHFLAVGRFVEKKAPHLTLLAFARVRERVPEARLLMIGDGSLLEACQSLARGLGVADAVEFPGAMDHDGVAAAMRRARAFVQHSVRPAGGDSEGTPVAVIEAQASGLPVVATRHAGIPDVVIDGETGYLVDEFDVAGMAERMLLLAGDTELARRLGAAGRRRVEDSFTMEQHIWKLWKIIEDAIGS